MKTSVIMLCGGLGSRISHITSLPKCLIKIKEEAILDLNLKAIQRSKLDIDSVYINIRRNTKEQLSSHLVKKDFKDNFIKLVVEENVKGTAGTVANIASTQNLSSGCLVVYGDQFYPDLEKLLEKLESLEQDKNMIFCYEGSDYRNSGVITKDEGSFMNNIVEKPKLMEGDFFLMNAGIYFLSNNFINKLNSLCRLLDQEVIDFSNDIFPKIEFKDYPFLIIEGKQPMAVDNEERFVQNKASI